MADNQEKKIVMLDPVTIDKEGLLRYVGMPGFVRSDKKCLIMLALSTIPGAYGNKTILLEDTKHGVDPALETNATYSGAYQLEAVSKYIIDKALQEKRTDIEFIILATKETREDWPNNPVYIVYKSDEKEQGEGPKKETHRLYQTDDAGTLRSPTASELFRTRMLEYAEEIDSEGLLQLRFIEYPMTENTRKDVQELMGLVRDETNDAVAPEIYIDIHGGPRPTQQLLINLLSILGEEGVHIDPNHILTVDGRVEPIKIAGEGFQINDFVAGIHEFTNYGRMESLDRFYKNRSSKPQNLINAMRYVSYTIQVCDMSEFEPALETLARELTDFKKSGDREDYLYSFLDLLIQGYDPLIKPAGDEYISNKDVLDEIRWCKKKGLYQQMLTLCEAKIPEFLSTHPTKENAIIQYDPELIDKGEEGQGDFELYNFIFNRTINSFAKKEQPTDGVYRSDMNGFKAAYELQIDHSEVLRNLLSKHFELKSLRNHSNHGSTDSQKETEPSDDKKYTEESLNALADSYLSWIEDILRMQWDKNHYPGDQRHIIIGRDELFDEVQSLRQFIKRKEHYVPEQALGNELHLSNVRLRRLYRLTGSIAERNSIAGRRQVLNNHDQATIREIHAVRNKKNKKNPLSYDAWLDTEFLTNDRDFWKKMGSSLGNCSDDPNFLYRLADIDTPSMPHGNTIHEGPTSQDSGANDAEASADVLIQQAQALATYLKTNYESICTDETPQLTNQKLQGLYKALCAAAPYCDQSNDEKVNAVRNCDISLLIYLFHQGNTNGRTNEQLVKTALKNKNCNPFWINVGDRLQEGLTKGWLIDQL